MNQKLQLIGAAFPRTGTMSIKKALEILGFHGCYHMHEVFLHPEHAAVWDAASNGNLPDWQTFLEGYSITLDAPACLFWRDMMQAFPDAKVLLLKRDPETWYDSMMATTYPVIMGPAGEMDPALKMIRRVFLEKFMNHRFEDREYATAKYRLYCQEVMADTPNDKLLVYDVSQGWQPLCDFLGLEVPAEPFPVKNTRKLFRERCGLG